MGGREPCVQVAMLATTGLLQQLTTGEWINAIVAGVTAVGVLWAIFQHLRSQKLSAKLAVLEHRRKVYDGLRDVLLELNNCGDDFHSVWVHAHQLWIDSEHLFKPPVRDYLKTIADKINELDGLRTQLRLVKETGDESERPGLVHKSREALDWLRGQHEARSRVFEPYLKLP